MNILIAHGIYGNPHENWFPWLKGELEKLGHKVAVPHFPTTKENMLEKWDETLDDYKKFLKDGIMIGHSLGVPFLLHVLEKNSAKAAFLVGGLAKEVDNRFKDMIKDFVQDFDWELIKNHCKHFTVFHSDDDPYLPIDIGEDLSKKLGVKLTFVPNAGHFNTESGYTKFPLLLEKIKEL